MIELKPFGGMQVDSETAKLFIGLQHLEPEPCMEYLISQIIKTEALFNLDELYIDLLRLTALFNSVGFIPAYNLGCGTIHILEELIGTDLIDCQEFLNQIYEKLVTVRTTPLVPGFTDRQRFEIISELQSSITTVVGYMRYLMEIPST